MFGFSLSRSPLPADAIADLGLVRALFNVGWGDVGDLIQVQVPASLLNVCGLCLHVKSLIIICRRHVGLGELSHQ